MLGFVLSLLSRRLQLGRFLEMMWDVNLSLSQSINYFACCSCVVRACVCFWSGTRFWWTTRPTSATRCFRASCQKSARPRRTPSSISSPSKPSANVRLTWFVSILSLQSSAVEQVLDILMDILSWEIAEVVSLCLPHGLWSHIMIRVFLFLDTVCLRHPPYPVLPSCPLSRAFPYLQPGDVGGSHSATAVCQSLTSADPTLSALRDVICQWFRFFSLDSDFLLSISSKICKFRWFFNTECEVWATECLAIQVENEKNGTIWSQFRWNCLLYTTLIWFSQCTHPSTDPVSTPNGIRILSAVLPQYTFRTDTDTHRDRQMG